MITLNLTEEQLDLVIQGVVHKWGLRAELIKQGVARDSLDPVVGLVLLLESAKAEATKVNGS